MLGLVPAWGKPTLLGSSQRIPSQDPLPSETEEAKFGQRPPMAPMHIDAEVPPFYPLSSGALTNHLPILFLVGCKNIVINWSEKKRGLKKAWKQRKSSKTGPPSKAKLTELPKNKALGRTSKLERRRQLRRLLGPHEFGTAKKAHKPNLWDDEVLFSLQPNEMAFIVTYINIILLILL